MLSIRARGEICLWKEGRVAKFAFEKGSVAIREGGVAFRHAKMAWEKRYNKYWLWSKYTISRFLQRSTDFLTVCLWISNLSLHKCCRGRVVKAMNYKSWGIFPQVRIVPTSHTFCDAFYFFSNVIWFNIAYMLCLLLNMLTFLCTSFNF